MIPIRWNDTEGKLAIGEQAGRYLGMSEQIKFPIVLARSRHGVGEAVSPDADGMDDLRESVQFLRNKIDLHFDAQAELQ